MDSPTKDVSERRGWTLGSSSRPESTLASVLWILIPVAITVCILAYLFPS